jgi:tetraacyldisaccharide 4'-kinase
MTADSSTRLWLAPLVPVYRLGLALRELRLRAGLERVRRLQWPVISVGSVSAGGAGKTPLTIALARALTRRGIAVDVLSRGYGRAGRAAARVVPEGQAEEFGDEPLVIAREAGVPVYLAAERFEAGRLAEGRSAGLLPGVHLLDDGFQHRQLARDVDVVLVSRRDGQDGLLPAGNLREPLRAARRADVMAIPVEEAELEGELRDGGWRGVTWRVWRRMEVPVVCGPVIAFCGIARPEQFFAGLEAAGLRLAARIAFRDHHRYAAGDLERLRTAARTAEAATLVTTEKDRVRLGKMVEMLPMNIAVKTAQFRVEIEDEEAAIDWLMEKLGWGDGSAPLKSSRKSSSDRASTPE